MPWRDFQKISKVTLFGIITDFRVGGVMEKYVLRLCSDIPGYQDWLFSTYPREYHLHVRLDANIFKQPVEMHIITAVGGFVESDELVGYANFEDYDNCAGEGTIDIALLPEFVGKSLVEKFTPAIKHMALALGYTALFATTTIARDESMRKCGYKLEQEWNDGSALYSISTNSGVQAINL